MLEYMKWNFIKESALDPYHEHCTYCSQDIMIALDHDIGLHIQRKKHKR